MMRLDVKQDFKERLKLFSQIISVYDRMPHGMKDLLGQQQY